MARKDYEDIAAKVLGITDVETAYHGEKNFLPLGTFNGSNSEEVLEAVTQHRLNVIDNIAGDILNIDHPNHILFDRDFRNFRANKFHDFDNYVWGIKNIKTLFGHNVTIKKNDAIIRKVGQKKGTTKNDLRIQDDAISDNKKLEKVVAHWSNLMVCYENNPNKLTPDYEGYRFYLKTIVPRFYSTISNLFIPALIAEDDMQRHSYITGGSGSGKSELLKQIVYSYTRYHPAYCATIVIDPHGDLVEDIAKWTDFAGHDRLIYLDMDLVKGYGPTLNPLELPEGVSSDVMAQQLLGAFEQMLAGEGGNSLTNNMRAILQPCLKVLLERKGSTLLDLKRFMKSDGRADDLIALGAKSQNIVTAEFFQYDFIEKKFDSTKGSIATKIDSVLASEATQAMFLGETSFDLLKAIENRQTVLVKLSKGIIGSEAAQAFGRFLIAYIQAIAIRRASEEAENRIPVHLIVDECHNFISESMEELLAESRKYKLYLTLAQQIAGYKMSNNLKRVVLGNTRIKMAGYNDDDGTVKAMANALEIDARDLSTLNVGEFYTRTGKGASKLLHVSDSLVNKDGQKPNDMSMEDWEILVQWQATHYYRNLENEGAKYVAPEETKEKIKSIKEYKIDLV